MDAIILGIAATILIGAVLVWAVVRTPARLPQDRSGPSRTSEGGVIHVWAKGTEF